ncbi:MAG: Pyruvate/2-oxoglutarate dehydrogenase [Candidatus Saganbacteria bacterium]|uniref:Pyruvate/2-oxoglutarate dehydrogenase n=1 Tax=Candidatus Saganbacteria bacterium TaxID=2575572 RepID=A0A833P0J7_UNCSA|nr:MAG: Pyruvate/2-oxoglutarate dehydrogenase [Candidatus Saganbacteria bacterium]
MIEEKIVEIYPSDKIQSPVHLSIGQEHHVVAICAALKKDDMVFATYRSHAPYLAKGGDLKAMFAELYGKHSGMAKGKAGSMHLCSPANGSMGSSAIVGSIFSHAMGVAYAAKLKKESKIAVALAGDGATEEGAFHECLNFSSLKNLPILYVIENNGLAIHAPLCIRQSYTLGALAGSYGIDYFLAEDGFDMENIFEKTIKIREGIVNTKRPFLLEIMTYRYKGHVGVAEDYDKGYRGRKELEEWMRRDPLVGNRALIEKYRGRIENEIAEAVNFAEKSGFPPREELLKDVY